MSAKPLPAIPVTNLRPSIAATRADWEANIERVFERSHFILGEQVEAFERDFAEAMGARFAVAVANGTQALELSLRDAGVKGEVLTSALTAPFTGVAIQAAGATPRFADIDPETLQIDAEDAAERITKRTAALIPVHLYGQPCAIAKFRSLSRNLVLIQDACQAHGARIPITNYVAYSFYPTKNLGCLGDGGAVATNNAVVAKRLRILRDGGRRGGQVAYVAGAINSRLDEMQACYLRAFLPKLREWNEDRARIARSYDEALRDCSGVRLVGRTSESVNHLYVVRAARRERLMTHLRTQGIGFGIHYPVPLHLHPAFAACRQKRGSLPVAERACREILSLPLWPYMPEEHVDRVISAIRAFYRK